MFYFILVILPNYTPSTKSLYYNSYKWRGKLYFHQSRFVTPAHEKCEEMGLVGSRGKSFFRRESQKFGSAGETDYFCCKEQVGKIEEIPVSLCSSFFCVTALRHKTLDYEQSLQLLRVLTFSLLFRPTIRKNRDFL